MDVAQVASSHLTPGMKQFKAAKEEYPDCVIMLRMGDFYELFYEDAVLASQVLGITLTARGKGESRAPLAGIPFHALDSYLGKFVKAGYKVAICEQLEDPKKAHGLVKRGVVRIVTPGTLVEENILEKNANNYLVAVCYDLDRWGLAYCDLSTGEFRITTFDEERDLIDEIHRIAPSELVLPSNLPGGSVQQHAKIHSIFLSSVDPKAFWLPKAEAVLKQHFGVVTLDGFGIEGHPAAIQASGGLLHHLYATQKQGLPHITSVKRYRVTDSMPLDISSIRNLELVRNIRDQSTKNSVLAVLDNCTTALGARLLRQWLLRPLLSLPEIVKRHEAVDYLTQEVTRLRTVTQFFQQISDIARIAGRMNQGRANARDLVALKQTILVFSQIRQFLQGAPALIDFSQMNDLSDVAFTINRTIVDDPPQGLREGGMVREGLDPELDRLRALRDNAASVIRELEQKERDRSGIASLKIKYNQVFGYFIEISNRHAEKVPGDYIRKQTIAQGERYFTPELKKLEEQILGSEEAIVSREYDIVQTLIAQTSSHTHAIQDIAHALATLDCCCSFADSALRYRYVRPEMLETDELELIGSRHPVVERTSPGFVANDCVLNETTRMLLITGPNMAGKSTYLRQVALNVLLAHIGSFVPCSRARIGLVDRIFTRIGAYDDLASGQSTFMIEMTETANILRNATKRSLVILDEIGRGTSTYDGISIAQAVFEHLHDSVGAKALFATHYHHLNTLATFKNRVANVHVKVQETAQGIAFLHTIERGGTDKSYGIHVARLAGIPQTVISQAQKIMRRIEAVDVLEETLEQRPQKMQPSLAAFMPDDTETQ